MTAILGGHKMSCITFFDDMCVVSLQNWTGILLICINGERWACVVEVSTCSLDVILMLSTTFLR